MKLSKETVSILKNFSSINNNLLLLEGNTQKTMSVHKTTIAEVTIAEELPMDFAIYDLAEFLGILSLFSDPELTFSEKCLDISDNGKTITFFAADKTLLKGVPKGSLKWPGGDVSFNLSNDDLATIMKAAGVLKTTDLAFVGDGKKIFVVVGNKDNNTANKFKLDIGKTTDKFVINLKVENFRTLVPSDYKVEISSKRISKFTSVPTDTVVYYLAVESDSQFSDKTKASEE